MEQVKSGLSACYLTMKFVQKELSQIQARHRALFVAYMQLMVFSGILALLFVFTGLFFWWPSLFFQFYDFVELDITGTLNGVLHYQLFSCIPLFTTKPDPVSESAWWVVVIGLGAPAIAQLWGSLLLLSAAENSPPLTTEERNENVFLWRIQSVVFLLLDVVVVMLLLHFYYNGTFLVVLRLCWMLLVWDYQEIEVVIPRSVIVTIYK